MKTKEAVFEETQALIDKLGFSVIQKDQSRPWGGFFVLDEMQAKDFADHFFPHLNFSEIQITNKLSPKILLVAPTKRLSWQYHHRRAEIWKCIGGTVGVITSDSDEETTKHILQDGDYISLKQGERHRLIGLNDWGMVAEIWQHTDESNPSNEDDIVRVQDDFGR